MSCPYGKCTMVNLCKSGYCVRAALESDGWVKTADGQLARKDEKK